MKLKYRIVSRTALLIAIIVALPTVARSAGGDKGPATIPDFTQGGRPDENHDWNLGPTGARGWIYGAKGRTADSRQILVTKVAAGSPAAGVLQPGDVILGVGAARFADDARISFARGIAAAEAEAGRGALRLIRWRDGATSTVELKLPIMGSYAATAPFACPKSAQVFERGCEAIARRGLNGVSIPNDMNALALLASGKPEYRELLAAYAQQVAEYRSEGFSSWHFGYAVMFLAEYYAATGDHTALAGLKRLALSTAHGQSAVGTWGHNFAMPNGNLNGYGCMNQPGLSLLISLVLAREAGVRDPALDRAIDKGASFLRWFVDKGAIPYGDHEPWPGHEDNGKCSSAAVLFDLLGDREAAEFFAKMSTAAYAERERGHTGNFFNVLWALPGVGRAGPEATGAYMKEQSWYYDLARSWDGSVPYQGSPAGEEEHNKYTDWDCTGAYLLAYALPRKSLMLTGKKSFSARALSGAEIDDVIAAGRDYFVDAGSNPFDRRTTERLFTDLASWSPTVRRQAAAALARRDGNFVPELLNMLKSPRRETRYGACEALGRLGPKADAAAPQLRALLQDRDPWLQSLAARALPALSDEVRRAGVSDLLAMSVRANPDDPRRMAQRAACMALFSPYPGQKEPRSILADSLEGVNRELLYPAVEAVLENDDAAARSSLTRIYGKLSDEDLIELLPSIVKAVENLAPSNEMFGDGIRLAGLDLLSRLHIREGMPLCVALIEPSRWGEGRRLPKCLEYLRRYGAHAQSVVPQLKEVRAKIDQLHRGRQRTDHLEQVDAFLAALAADKSQPTLVELKDFKSSAPPRK